MLEEILLRQRTNNSESIAYAQQATDLAHRLKHARFEAYFLIVQGQIADKGDNYILATTYFQAALRLSATAGLQGRTYPAQAEIGLAGIAGAEDDFRKAAEHGRLALRYAQQIKTGLTNRLTLEGGALSMLTRAYIRRLEQEGHSDSLRPQARRYAQAMAPRGPTAKIAGPGPGR